MEYKPWLILLLLFAYNNIKHIIIYLIIFDCISTGNKISWLKLLHPLPSRAVQIAPQTTPAHNVLWMVSCLYIMMDSFHYFVFDGNPNNDGKGTAVKNANWLHKPYIAINQQHIGQDLDATCCCQIITCFIPILKMYSVRAVQLVLVVYSPINMTQSAIRPCS